MGSNLGFPSFCFIAQHCHVLSADKFQCKSRERSKIQNPCKRLYLRRLHQDVASQTVTNGNYQWVPRPSQVPRPCQSSSQYFRPTVRPRWTSASLLIVTLELLRSTCKVCYQHSSMLRGISKHVRRYHRDNQRSTSSYTSPIDKPTLPWTHPLP